MNLVALILRDSGPLHIFRSRYTVPLCSFTPCSSLASVGAASPSPGPSAPAWATHLACLAALCAWITLAIFTYASLPPWLTGERDAGRLGYTIVEVVFLAAIVLMLYFERRRIYVKDWSSVPAGRTATAPRPESSPQRKSPGLNQGFTPLMKVQSGWAYSASCSSSRP